MVIWCATLSPCSRLAESRGVVEESPTGHKNRSEGRVAAQSGIQKNRKENPMELLGQCKCYDENAKPHQFQVFRSVAGYSVQLDGAQIAAPSSHLDAIATIAEEAEKRGFRRK